MEIIRTIGGWYYCHEIRDYLIDCNGLKPYRGNPSRSQSSPWARSDMWRKPHPFDALLAERRAILAGERAAIAEAASKDAAWWGERRRG